jgi:hypothetical protein
MEVVCSALAGLSIAYLEWWLSSLEKKGDEDSRRCNVAAGVERPVPSRSQSLAVEVRVREGCSEVSSACLLHRYLHATLRRD